MQLGIYGQSPPKSILLDAVSLKSLVNYLFESLSTKTNRNRKNHLSKHHLETLSINTDVFCEMAEKIQKHEEVLNEEAKTTVLKYMDVIIRVMLARRSLSSEEVDDLNLEVQRFHRIVTMCALESVPQFHSLSMQSKKRFGETVRKPLLSIKKYSAEQDEVVKTEQVSWYT
ncbi:hypothetical protein C0J52_05535 [Blattella germanica]|nr:hypothetical protein C0J52_05535 [Blattella germanica]